MPEQMSALSLAELVTQPDVLVSGDMLVNVGLAKASEVVITLYEVG